VKLFFKTYGQSKKNIQTGTVHAIFADEELPEDFFDELMFRLAATGGYFHMVFTATLGQQLWWDVIEGRGDGEKFPNAFKRQVSMYDCLHYMDGTPSTWTLDRIKEIEASCKSQSEIDKRVLGKFTKTEGLIYPTFDARKHLKAPHPIPDNWRIYPGIDSGGGGDGHPGAIAFVAVSPDYKHGRVFMTWRGDGVDTTAADIVNQYIKMRGLTETMPAKYDFAAKDLATIAGRMGIGFSKAEKSHEIGQQVLNTLFKHNMLFIYDTPDNQKLVNELLMLRHSTNKRRARDDLVDALRYACAEIPWDFHDVSVEVPETILKKQKTDIDLRREAFFSEEEQQTTIEEEFDGWNEMYGAE
jgi:phage terminase large subunit-like protein